MAVYDVRRVNVRDGEWALSARRCRWGFMQHLRVFVCGVEVTQRCFYLDGRRRRVGLYVKGSDGYVRDGDGIAREWIQGRRVTWTRPRVSRGVKGITHRAKRRSR